jgi:hypothetical protein
MPAKGHSVIEERRSLIRPTGSLLVDGKVPAQLVREFGSEPAEFLGIGRPGQSNLARNGPISL